MRTNLVPSQGPFQHRWEMSLARLDFQGSERATLGCRRGSSRHGGRWVPASVDQLGLKIPSKVHGGFDIAIGNRDRTRGCCLGHRLVKEESRLSDRDFIQEIPRSWEESVLGDWPVPVAKLTGIYDTCRHRPHALPTLYQARNSRCSSD